MLIGLSLRPVFLVVLFLAVTAVRAADPSDDVFDLDRLHVRITPQLPAVLCKALLNLGYPPHKLKWYRGGMQSWEQLGLTTVKSDG